MGMLRTDRRNALTYLALGTSLALYTVSFFLPAMVDPNRRLLGYEAFVTAFFYPHLALVLGFPRGAVFLLFFPCWWANVFYALAVRRLLDGRRRGVFALALCAALFGLSTLLSFRWFPPRPVPLAVFREGYWLWVGAMLVLTLIPFRGEPGWDFPGETLAQKWDD